MSALRKFRTRKTSRFARRSLSSKYISNVYNFRALKAVNEGLQYDPYRRRSRWHFFSLFHDSSRLVDSVVRLTGLTPGEIEDRYDSVPDLLAEGFSDSRRFTFNPLSSVGDISQPIARVPARIRGTKYLVAPPFPVVSPAGSNNQFLQFNSPRQVLTCVRRHQRREVLFALERFGSGHKRPQWREDSHIRC